MTKNKSSLRKLIKFRENLKKELLKGTLPVGEQFFKDFNEAIKKELEKHKNNS